MLLFNIAEVFVDIQGDKSVYLFNSVDLAFSDALSFQILGYGCSSFSS